MPNTKEVEQAAKQAVPDLDNPNAFSFPNRLVVDVAREAFIAGYELEQSEKKLTQLFYNKFDAYIMNDDNLDTPCMTLERFVEVLSKLSYNVNNEQSENKEEWVSVETALPEDMKSVLFCTKDVHNPAMIPLQGYYNATAKVWVGYLWSQKRTDVTHWIYTPKPPKNLV